MGDHVGEQSVAGDVERHSESHVCGALIQLTTEFAVSHVELSQAVARRQRHEWQVARVPCAHNDAPIIGRALQCFYHFVQLVDPFP